jgi:acyl-CoA thioesterase-1
MPNCAAFPEKCGQTHTMKIFPLLLLTMTFGTGTLGTAAMAQNDLNAKPEPGAAKPTPKADPLKPIEDVPGLPRVLLIGDSISIGYTLPVRELLQGKANVHRILTNGAATKDGLAKLKTWLGDKPWDVIHFIWGLHDIKYVDEKQNVPLADYEKNLRELVNMLKATGATLIWCSTTPVPDAKQNPMRKTADVIEYNAVAKKIMDENGVAIDDLYAFAMPQIEKIQLKANVHYTAQGYDELAKQVAASIEAAQPKKN